MPSSPRRLVTLVALVALVALQGSVCLAGPRRDMESSTAQLRAGIQPVPSQDHRSGLTFGVIPLSNYSSDTGFGLGAGGALLDFADGRDTYRNAFFLKLFITTRWVQLHAFQWDAPHIGGSDVSVWVRAEFRRQIDANYFGSGNTTPHDAALSSSGSTRFVTKRYYQYLFMAPVVTAQVRWAFRERFSLLAGYTFRYMIVDPYAKSLLAEQRPTGHHGGITSMLHAGLVLDTRDHKPLTRTGHWIELSARVSGTYLGGSTTFGGVTLSDRHYWNPIGGFVIAHRLLVDLLFGDVPFYLLPSFGDASLTDGLGGAWSVRGISGNRYTGKIKIVFNQELRQHFLTWRWFHARFDLGGVAFFDVGRVWQDYAADGPLWNLHWGAGGGLRLVWNQSFQARFEAAGSYEGAKFYVELFALF